MQKIVIRNFGAIEEADINVKKIVVLIGEQASGKSTIAKLIYFFKALSDKVFDRFYKSSLTKFSIPEHLVFPIRDEFYNLFGSTRHLQDFEIIYFFHHEEKRFIKLRLGEKKQLLVEPSSGFISREMNNALNRAKEKIISIDQLLQNNLDSRTQIALTEDKLQQIQSVSNQINTVFENNQNLHQYLIAGRESTVSYQATFESYMEKTLMEALDDNRKKTSIERAQTVDEILMLDFLRETQRIRSVFRKYGGSFRSVVSNLIDNKNEAMGSTHEGIPELGKVCQLILSNAELILKGEYEIDQLGEKIRHSSDGYVYLKDASSGQKESIRILQHIFLGVIENQKFFRVVEEPEAHLFPLAQKSLIELLILMTNHLSENQLVITTHSPYVLTVINNLLFASRVLAKNQDDETEISKIIKKDFFIAPELFSAYSLGNSFLPDSKPCENIFNEKTGVIKQNYLDIVSEMLGADFNRLYSIHSQSFLPKQV